MRLPEFYLRVRPNALSLQELQLPFRGSFPLQQATRDLPTCMARCVGLLSFSLLRTTPLSNHV